MNNKMKILVTGCCGFLGSHMVDFLLKNGHKVVGIDNLSTGNKKFIINALKNKNFKFYKLDLLKKKFEHLFKKVNTVFHFSANADVRYGLKHRNKDIQQNIIVTYRVLEAMKKKKVKKIVFSSSGSVYGEPNQFPTKETCNFPIQTSLYGASKISAESLIQAYCEGYNFKSYIFRFVSLLGERYSHGHVFDFTKQLIKNEKKLIILGNGKQTKSYLNVKDCIEAMWIGVKYFKKKINIINLGTNEFCTVKESAKWISKNMNLKPKFYFLGGKRGWIGDSPFIYLGTKKILSTGWKPKFTIKESIKITSDFLMSNKWLLKIK